MLLRVSKVKKRGERATFDYIAQHKYFLRDIKPHLGGYTVYQELVKVHYAKGLIKEMNTILEERQKNGDRRKKFNDTWAGETDWAFALENMMPEGETWSYELRSFISRVSAKEALTDQLQQTKSTTGSSSSSRSGSFSRPPRRPTPSVAANVPHRFSPSSPNQT